MPVNVGSGHVERCPARELGDAQLVKFARFRHNIRISTAWKISAMGSKGTGQNRLGLIELLSGKLRRGVTSRLIDASATDVYRIHPRKDGNGVDLISNRLLRGAIWYPGPDAVRSAIAYAKYRSHSRSRRVIIRVCTTPRP
jgi:hypothetical protein